MSVTRVLQLLIVIVSPMNIASAQTSGLPNIATPSASNVQDNPNQISILQKYFNPFDVSLHTCRAVTNGGPSSIKVFMCLILKGGVISMPGDIAAVAMNQTRERLEVFINCRSTYMPSLGFKPVTMPGWGHMGLTLSADKPNDFIGIGSVSQADRVSWTYGGTDECTWTAKKAPDGPVTMPPLKDMDIGLSASPRCKFGENAYGSCR